MTKDVCESKCSSGQRVGGLNISGMGKRNFEDDNDCSHIVIKKKR